MDTRSESPESSISVAELLELDQTYRARAEAGELRRIAPKKNNPTGEAWLPIMHAEHEGRQYTVLFSNTERAHDLSKTDDWVVIYRDDPAHKDQWTVVTEHRGPLKGERVVRGREEECRAYYEER